jgi:hypothetical protein
VQFVHENNRCRLCKEDLRVVKNFGKIFSCGKFPNSLNEEVEFSMLKISICTGCSMIQLQDNYEQSLLYTDSYGYQSSLNNSMVSHLALLAEQIAEHFSLSEKREQFSHLDIGSNDATLINLIQKRIPENPEFPLIQLGIDPTASPYLNNYKKSQIIVKYFTHELAISLQYKFKVITSIAMLYDLPNPIDFFQGIKANLDTNGIWISEQSYFFSMIDENAFDTVCQEHLEYYTLKDITNLCANVGLEIFDVIFNDCNGGSFRFYVQHIGGTNKISDRYIKALRSESIRDKESELLNMLKRVEIIKEETLKFLLDCKSRGLEVHGYGASTKGNMLLQYFGINKDLLPFIAEINKNKFGKFTPGSNIPIISEQQSKLLNPYAYLVLPWHFKTSILERESSYIQSHKTKFCFPLPSFTIC